MDSITLRLEPDTIKSLDDEADEHGVSRSEYIRTIIDRRHEHDRIRDEYEERIDDLKRDVERLQNEKQALIDDRQEKQKLVEYVEEEQSWRSASLPTRLRWWVFGKD